jgi:MGT family glycosyltransferase
MSKIAFIGLPAHGHTNPTLSVVQELVERGEQVVCYNSPEFRTQIERTGAVFRAYPASPLSATQIAAALQAGNLANITPLVMRGTEQLLPYLLDDLPHNAPDLVIFDSIALWGRMAATRLNLRAASSITHFVYDVTHLMSESEILLRHLWQMLPKLMGAILVRRRLNRRYPGAFPSVRPLMPMRGGLNLVYTIRELQPETPIIDATFRFVGPSINPQTRSETFPLEALSQAKVVYMSLGTVHQSRTELFRECLAVFADYPAQFILSVGKEMDIAALGAVPPNCVVHPSVPQLEVLQRVQAFITHGGMNSIHEGLYYGVPLLIIPQQLEQLLNARGIEKAGAGLTLDQPLAGKLLPRDALRQALDKILTEAQYQQAAARSQNLLRAAGGYKQAADEILTYIAARTP